MKNGSKNKSVVYMYLFSVTNYFLKVKCPTLVMTQNDLQSDITRLDDIIINVTPRQPLLLTNRVFVMLSDSGKKPRSHFTSWLNRSSMFQLAHNFSPQE